MAAAESIYLIELSLLNRFPPDVPKLSQNQQNLGLNRIA